MSYAAEPYRTKRPNRYMRSDHPKAMRRPRGGATSGRTRRNERRATHDNPQHKVSREIVLFFRKQRGRFLDAMNFKDATGQLFKKLRHTKQLIVKAFRQLTSPDSGIIRREEYGYRLMIA